MLEIISKEMIVLNANCTTWQEAVRVAAEPLVTTGSASEAYIDAIIKNVEESGPYIVIAPHIAIPHARAEGQVHKNAIGICTLMNPVSFGNSANDPVKYLFCLAATDNSTHMQWLSQMALLLEDEEFYRLLDTAKTSQEVIDYLQRKGE